MMSEDGGGASGEATVNSDEGSESGESYKKG
jgi:hypothetical protein